MGPSKVTSNDVQHLFLQAVMSRKILSEKLARTLWQKCIEAVKMADDSLDISFRDTLEEWNSFVVKVNKSLDPLDLEFRGMMDEAKGVKVYALANTKGDEVAQMATDYNPAEISYFKAIVEQIMLSPNQSFSLSSMVALREVSSLKATMTKTQAEVVLGSFVAKGWLLKSKKGRYSLSSRTVLELQTYLKTTYTDEILECTICLDIITKGITCSKTNCHTYLHNHCYATYSGQSATCPTCSQDWSGGAVFPLGEAAAKDGQDGRRRTRRRSAANLTDNENESDGMEEPSQTQSQSQSQGKKAKTVAKGGKKAKGRGAKGRGKSPGSESMDEDVGFEEELSKQIEDAMDIDNLTQDNNRGTRSSRKR